jgi:hypothetical protein
LYRTKFKGEIENYLRNDQNIRLKSMPKLYSGNLIPKVKPLFTTAKDIAMLAMHKLVHFLKALNLFRLPAAFRGGSICSTAKADPSIYFSFLILTLKDRHYGRHS